MKTLYIVVNDVIVMSQMNSPPPNFSDSELENEVSRISDSFEDEYSSDSDDPSEFDSDHDEDNDNKSENLQQKHINIYHGKRNVHQKHVDYMSAINIANTVASGKCTKKDANNRNCLARLNADQDLLDGNFKDSTQLITLLRGDMINMSESEKNKYIENLMSSQAKVSRASNRLMAHYSLSHVKFKKGESLYFSFTNFSD